MPKQRKRRIQKIQKEWFKVGWRRIVYYLGYLGVLGLLYWLIQIIGYFVHKKEEPEFLGTGFRRRTYYYGWLIVSIILLITMIVIYYLISLAVHGGKI
ncbi:MAG: hypothetical protein HY362_01570 [Candidatus Aenigmarchaeota archaeon]|nr:hypothetical protein [Candidatus Aenigmarchaeota archaeon]